MAEFRPVNLAEIYGQIDAAKANQAQMQNNAMMQERQRRQFAMEDEELAKKRQFKDIYSSSYDNVDGVPTLNQGRLLSKLVEVDPLATATLQQGFKKQEMETKAAELENQLKLGQYAVDAMARVPKGNNEAWQQTIQMLKGLGVKSVDNLPQIYDKNAHMSFMMTGKDWLEQNKPVKQEIVFTPNNIAYDKNNPASLKIGENYSPQAKSESKPASVQEYEYAKTQGYTGTFQEFQGASKPNKSVETSTGLRKEFDDLPEVKNYKAAKTAYKSLEDAAKRNTTASDINIVYGIAKLYDPTSVVREGEYATVANSPNIPEKIKGFAQYLSNGGRLTPQTKDDILAEAKSRIGAYENEYLPQRKNYESIAKNSGADPKLVFPSDFTSAAPVTPPEGAKPKGATGKTKIINGVTYINDGKGWKKK
jgi:hypothetical protein